ncbi:MAG: hypothetical protein V7638_1955 [Acidobacteriota bacterium]|jgi:hypothetical protein
MSDQVGYFLLRQIEQIASSHSGADRQDHERQQVSTGPVKTGKSRCSSSSNK